MENAIVASVIVLYPQMKSFLSWQGFFFWFSGSSGKFFEEKFYSTIKSFDVCENLEAGERFVLLE